MPNIRWFIALVTKVHRWIFVKTGGSFGSRILHMRFLMIIHTGRRSGLERKTPLLCVEVDTGWCVASSNGGDDREPAWWLNLQAHPEAQVLFAGREYPVVARRAREREHDEMWAKLQRSYPFFDSYRRRTTRDIAVVVLEREAEARAPAAAAS